MSLNVPKETELAWKLMDACCGRCTHWHYPEFGDPFGVCKISCERSDEGELCEDFVFDEDYGCKEEPRICADYEPGEKQ